MNCKNESRCKQVSEERFSRMERHLDTANNRLNKFRDAYELGIADLAFDDHAEFRVLWRAFSESQVLEAVLKGEIIESRFKNGEYGFLIWYNIKLAARQYRPMHVSVTMLESNPNFMIITTVYDPRSKEWVWTENYTRRICLCDTREQ
ncbi:DUF4258 domain-containing protein [Paenibacillus agricola]|uniref:DUF4258 domain-containing protein n=1 Tax=Paenibacillus agricola TaxID=2716264 RepID=A0ABX0JEL3_9BACL|nr:DUF4258 domain-containing protein [Paenibacillus agricola]NHN33327.1 DUF4258 domain-containing protein [Paenibacillus agricola]